MTSTGVNGINLFSSASLSTNASSNTTSQTESFDKTFQSMKGDTASEKIDVDRAEQNGSDRSKIDEMTSTKTKNPVKKEEEVTDEQIAAMSDEIIGQVKQVIMDELQVTEEQLDTAISELGLTEESLLNPMELSQVVMKLEGIESQGDMLTNPDFAKNLKDIISSMEDIKENVTMDTAELEKLVTDNGDELVNDDTVQSDDMQVQEQNIADRKPTDTVVAEDTELTADMPEEAISQKQADANDSNGLLQHQETKETETLDSPLNENLMMTPEDFAAKLTQDLTESVGETRANDIVRQVLDQAQVQVKQGVTSMEMQLYPEHLGKVLIQVSTHDGHVTAQITAESEAAKNALESQLTLLKENLNNQGLKIENVEVTIASHAFEQNMQGERGNDEQASQGRKTRRSIGSFFDDVQDESYDDEQEKIMEITGSTVSYSA